MRAKRSSGGSPTVPSSLTKGQNGALATNDIIVTVALTAAADLSALLVKADGKVRSDNDFVFFNQPTAPGARLHDGFIAVGTGPHTR